MTDEEERRGLVGKIKDYMAGTEGKGMFNQPGKTAPILQDIATGYRMNPATPGAQYGPKREDPIAAYFKNIIAGGAPTTATATTDNSLVTQVVPASKDMTRVAPEQSVEGQPSNNAPVANKPVVPVAPGYTPPPLTSDEEYRANLKFARSQEPEEPSFGTYSDQNRALIPNSSMYAGGGGGAAIPSMPTKPEPYSPSSGLQRYMEHFTNMMNESAQEAGSLFKHVRKRAKMKGLLAKEGLANVASMMGSEAGTYGGPRMYEAELANIPATMHGQAAVTAAGTGAARVGAQNIRDIAEAGGVIPARDAIGLGREKTAAEGWKPGNLAETKEMLRLQHPGKTEAELDALAAQAEEHRATADLRRQEAGMYKKQPPVALTSDDIKAEIERRKKLGTYKGTL